MASITETWIKAGGSRDGLHDLMLITKRHCPNAQRFATVTMAVQGCGCSLHTYVRSEPGLYRVAYVERNRDAYVSAEWDLWSREDERVST